ncbi:hypothetical protein Bca4012_032561 [Brassica carinata]
MIMYHVIVDRVVIHVHGLQFIRGNSVKPLRTIRIPWFDNSDIIRSLNKTLIGRITNPDTQNVGSLVSMMPKIWKLDDDRVTDRVLRRIGNELGTVREVDEVNARVKVTVDGTKPLCFEIPVLFETEEVDVKVEYEKLFGYCATCFRLSHDKESCPESDLRKDVEEERDLKMHATICMVD